MRKREEQRSSMKPGLNVAACFAAFALFCTGALAQDDAPDQPITTESGRLSYPASYFASFRPRTALDMIERLPGFVVDSGASDLRGFGGAAGNVLVDGARPTTKADGLRAALTRIPASQVERIELIRGSAGAGEAAGQSVVANVVRVEGASSRTWSAGLERAPDGLVYPNGELVIAEPLGAWNTTLRLRGFWERYPRSASISLTDPAGNLIRSQAGERPSVFSQLRASGEARRDLFGGELRLSGLLLWSAFFADTERLNYEAREIGGTADGRDVFSFDSVLNQAELGADWTREFDDDWTWRLVGLVDASTLSDDSLSEFERPVGDTTSDSLFTLRQTDIEIVARTTLARGGERTFRPEIGGEIAFNSLDSALAFVDDGTPILLPAANVRVEEIRGEAFANLIWQATPRLTVESGVAIEASEISVTGDAISSQTFVFVKPSAALVYEIYDGGVARLSLQRRVGQLNFSDFAASADAVDDRQIAGNPNLGPDQATRAAVSLDLRFGERGAFNIEGYHEWREDVLEQVVLPSGGVGIANAGSATVWGGSVSASAQLSPWIPGGLIEIEAETIDSRFTDPLTGEERGLTSLRSPTISLAFRQDLEDSQFAWGFGHVPSSQSTSFYFSEADRLRTSGVWSAFVETTRFEGLRLRLEARNLGVQRYERRRLIYDPDRSGNLVLVQEADRHRGTFVTFTVEGEF